MIIKIKIKETLLPKELRDKIKHPDPLIGEDIFIEDEKGDVIGVIIQPKAYNFFLKKIEEIEDKLDSSIFEEYDSTAKTLDDLRKGSD